MPLCNSLYIQNCGSQHSDWESGALCTTKADFPSSTPDRSWFSSDLCISTIFSLIPYYLSLSSFVYVGIRTSVDALCRDGIGLTSRNPHAKGLQSCRERLAKASNLPELCLQTDLYKAKSILRSSNTPRENSFTRDFQNFVSFPLLQLTRYCQEQVYAVIFY